MARKITQEQRLEASMKKIDRLYNWAANEHFAVAQNKEELTEKTTLEGYKKKTKTMMNAYYEKYGVGDVTRIDPDKMHDLLVERYPNASSFKGYVHALHYTVAASAESNVFKEPIEIVDKEKELDYAEENGLIRYASDSTVLKSTHEENEEVIRELENSRSPFKNEAILAMKMGEMFGTRVAGALDLRARDITIHDDGIATVHLVEKGDLPRWVHVFEPEAADFAKELKESVENENHTIIPPMKYQSGEDKGRYMDHGTAAQRLAEVVSSASQRAGYSNPEAKDEPSLSIHSTRKTFCQSRVDHYASMSHEELKNELEDRFRKQEELQEKIKEEGSNYQLTSFRDKYEKAVERVNWVEKPSAANSDGIRRTATDRDLNHKELCFLLTSFDSGHFRVDVLRYYAKYYKPSGK